MNRRTFLASLAATAALPRWARSDPFKDRPGTWLDWHDDLNEARTYAPDLRERTAFLANLADLARVLRKKPVWDKPVGFNVRPTRTIGVVHNSGPGPAPIPGMLIIYATLFAREGNKIVEGDTAIVAPKIAINSVDSVFATPIASDAAGTMYWEPRAIPSKAGVLRYETGHVLTKRTQPVFVPVTQRRLLAAWIAEARHELKGRPNSPVLAKEIDALEHELAALSARDADAQAYAKGASPRRLARPGDKDARPVAAPNPSFFDASAPRSALQLAVVYPLGNDMFDDPDHERIGKALQTLPWKELQDALA